MLLTVLILALSLLALMVLAQLICARIDTRRFPAPGRIVSVPGGETHVREMGAGAPPVVLEAGIAASSLSWSVLQPYLAAFTSTCSYDRPGFGWSRNSSRNGRFSLGQASDDLRALVVALNLPQPYILVAHSFGSLIVTEYARRHAGELAGVVLVDPLTPEEWIRPTRGQRWILRRGVWFSRAGGALASLGVLRLCLWLLQRGNREAPRGVLRLFGKRATETVEHILSELAKLPPETVRLIRARWSTSKFFWTMAAYIQSVPACSAEMAGCPIPSQVPVTVLSGGQQPPIRLEEHAAIAAYSQRGRHMIADKSAHWIHLDQPELVARAVRELADHLQCTPEPTIHEEGRRA